jgi:hypothetical protein
MEETMNLNHDRFSEQPILLTKEEFNKRLMKIDINHLISKNQINESNLLSPTEQVEQGIKDLTELKILKDNCDQQIIKGGDDLSIWKNNRDMIEDMITRVEGSILPVATEYSEKEAA